MSELPKVTSITYTNVTGDTVLYTCGEGNHAVVMDGFIKSNNPTEVTNATLSVVAEGNTKSNITYTVYPTKNTDVKYKILLGAGESLVGAASESSEFTLFISEDVCVSSDEGGSELLQAQTLHVASGNIDLDVSQYALLSITVVGDITLSLVGEAEDGLLNIVTVEVINGGSHTFTWDPTITWVSGEAPSLKESGIDVITLYSKDAGANWSGYPVS